MYHGVKSRVRGINPSSNLKRVCPPINSNSNHARDHMHRLQLTFKSHISRCTDFCTDFLLYDFLGHDIRSMIFKICILYKLCIQLGLRRLPENTSFSQPIPICWGTDPVPCWRYPAIRRKQSRENSNSVSGKLVLLYRLTDVHLLYLLLPVSFIKRVNLRIWTLIQVFNKTFLSVDHSSSPVPNIPIAFKI